MKRLVEEPEELEATAPAAAPGSSSSAFRRRLLASKKARYPLVFLALTAMHAMVLLVMKLASSSRAYAFSPASAIVCTEVTKLGLAAGLYAKELREMPKEMRPASFDEKATLRVWGATTLVALLYAVNNVRR